MKFSRIAFSFAFVSLLFVSAAQAAPEDRTQYSRDSRYIYAKTPMPLNFSMSEKETAALKEATQKIMGQLTGLQSINPRAGLRGNIDKSIAESAPLFESSLDNLVGFAQKYYTTLAEPGYKLTSAVPSAFIVFSGFEVTGGWVASGGGSVMLGIVFVPMHVTRIEIDTNNTEEYTEFDSNLIVWPSANIGVGAGGGANFRGGAGLIWGQLASAKEFAGLVVGPSVSGTAGIGGNMKLGFLKNWSKKGAVSNVFVTVGAELGASAKLEGHGNISYVVDAESYLKAGQSGVEKLLNKLFSSAPAANKPVNPAALPPMAL